MIELAPGTLSDALKALAIPCVVLAVLIWMLTEALSRGLSVADWKRWPAVRFALQLAPLVVGAVICGQPTIVNWMMEIGGYTPKNPLDAGAGVIIGLACGATAVVFNGRIRALAERAGADRNVTVTTTTSVSSAPAPPPETPPPTIILP